MIGLKVPETEMLNGLEICRNARKFPKTASAWNSYKTSGFLNRVKTNLMVIIFICYVSKQTFSKPCFFEIFSDTNIKHENNFFITYQLNFLIRLVKLW